MEQKDENKKEKKSQLLIAAIIFIAALGFVLNFGGDKLNNNLHYHKKYIEAVDDMMSEDFDTANAKFSIVFDEFKNYKNTEFFRDFCQACTYYKNDKFIEAGNELPDYGANYRLSGKQRDLVEKWTGKIQSKYKYAIEHPTTTIPFEEEYSEFVSRYRSTSQSSESDYTTAKRSTGAKGSSFYPRPSRNSSSGSEGKTSKKTTTKKYTTKRTTTKKTTTKKYDPYDAADYYDPEDFYYDHYDDFFDYEEAEDYFYEHN